MSITHQDTAGRLAQLSANRRALLERRLSERRGPGQPAARTDRHVRELEPAPLSHVQAQMWTAEQFGPGMPTYNIPFAFRIRGPLDPAALARAIELVVARHPALRTVYTDRGGEPVQIVRPAGEFGVGHGDLSDEPAAAREQAAADWAASEASTPFDLAGDHKLRATLLRLGSEDHLLLLTVHHLSADGWSVGLVLAEVRAAYAAYVAGRAADLGPEPLSYADYAVRDRTERTRDRLAADLRYWTQQLGGDAPPLQLPADRRRPPVQSFRGDAYRFTLPAGLGAAISSIGQASGATLVSTLIAAFHVLLHRLSGQDDIRVGLSVALRDKPELEKVVGCLLNVVAVRADLSPDPVFAELASRVHQTCMQAYAHRMLPLPMLVDQLRRGRDPSRNPVFQAMFVLTDALSLELANCTVEPVPVSNQAAKMDVTLVMERGDGDQLSGYFEYATDLFDRSTIAVMARCWRVLLDGIAARPDCPVSRLPLITAQERARLLAAGRPAASVALTPTVPEQIAGQVRRRPEAIAVSCAGRVMTYRELAARSDALSWRLARSGVGRGDIVGICADRSAQVAAGLLAIWKAGAAYLPIEPTVPDARMRFMLTDAGAAAVIADQPGNDRFADLGLPVLGLAEPGSAEHGPATAPPGPDDAAYVIYTSGSTGKPKGVCVTHGNVARLFRATAGLFGFSEDDRWSVFHSVAFDFSVWELWGALAHGGTAIIVPHEISRAPAEFYELLAGEQVTVLSQTPTAFGQLLAIEDTVPCLPGLDSLRLVIFGGEALDPAALAPWFDRHGDDRPRLVNMYGITETTVHVTCRPLTCADATAGRGSLIGAPLPDLGILLLDKNGDPVPDGVPGEICVTGAGVSRGYVSSPPEHAQRFRPGPDGTGVIYRSGDLARRLPDGDLAFIGRIDDQVQLHGHRIELKEVESALRACAGVRDAAVIVREDAPGDKVLTGYIVPRGAGTPGPVELRAELGRWLPPFMIPTVFHSLREIPVTANGKRDLRALPMPSPIPASTVPAPAKDGCEALIAGIWREALGIDQISLDDNFFDVGGDSLRLTKVYALLRASVAVAPSMVDLLRYTTIRSLAGYLRGAESQAAAADAERAMRLRSQRSDMPARWLAERRTEEAGDG